MAETCNCAKPMRNIGSIDGIIHTRALPQWDEVHVCDECKTKKIVRVYGDKLISIDLSDYEELI